MLFATVEHSGTRHCVHVMGWVTHPLSEEATKDPRHVLFDHLYDESMDAIIEAATRMAVVTTYRPFNEIRASWVRRGKDLANLDSQMRNYERLLALNPYVIHLGGGSDRLTPELARHLK